MTKAIWLPCALLIFMQCSPKVTHPTDYFFGEEAPVRQNETVIFLERGEKQPTLPGVEVRLETIKDSRCPANAQCVWEGNVTARFRLSDHKSTVDTTLCCCGSCSLAGSQSGKRSDSVSVQLNSGRYTLVIKDVTPYPVQGKQQESPKAIIRVNKQ